MVEHQHLIRHQQLIRGSCTDGYVRRLIRRFQVALYLEMVSNGVDARLPQPDDPDSPDAEVIG